jgi:CRP-like cAMP-binding protein
LEDTFRAPLPKVSSAENPLAPLLHIAKVRHYPKGQIILYEGENPTDAFVVKSGAVKIYDIDEDGNEKILHIVKSNGIFPMIFLFGSAGQTNTFYTTVTDSELYVLSRDSFEERMQSDPALVVYCLRWFADEVQEMLRRMSSLEKTSTRSKLIATLAYLSRQHCSTAKNGWQRVQFPISHQLLADMIGVTRESTTMVMKSLQKEKLVRTPKLGILDINALLINNIQ